MNQKPSINREEILNLFGRKKPKQFEKVKINNLFELKKLVQRLQPTTIEHTSPIIVDTKQAKMSDDSFSGKVTIPQSSGDTLYKTLLDGFSMIKNHREYYSASISAELNPDDYGGYLPAKPSNPEDHVTWLDIFIEQRLGGKRDGLSIVWDLPEGQFKLDPWSGKLEKQ